MVAPEPGELLLLYITVTAEAVSMVWVIERLEPQQPQVLKGASTGGSGSQDPKPTAEPRVEVAVGSQLPKASLAPDHQEESHSTAESQLLEAALVFDNLGATVSHLLGAVLVPRGQESPGHLEASDPDVPDSMEPAKDCRCHGGLCAPRRVRSRSSSQS
jgi:hypothetical protein